MRREGLSHPECQRMPKALVPQTNELIKQRAARALACLHAAAAATARAQFTITYTILT